MLGFSPLDNRETAGNERERKDGIPDLGCCDCMIKCVGLLGHQEAPRLPNSRLWLWRQLQDNCGFFSSFSLQSFAFLSCVIIDSFTSVGLLKRYRPNNLTKCHSLDKQPAVESSQAAFFEEYKENQCFRDQECVRVSVLSFMYVAVSSRWVVDDLVLLTRSVTAVCVMCLCFVLSITVTCVQGCES